VSNATATTAKVKQQRSQESCADFLRPDLLLPKVAERIAVEQRPEQVRPKLKPDCADVFLPYQQRWIRDKSQVKVSVKSRRIGLSWADAYESVLTAASGECDCYYVGYNQVMAEQYISDCAEWAGKIGAEYEPQGVKIISDPDKDILIFRIRFASGCKISALSSKPTNLRAKKGRFVLDEYAFHPNPEELLKAGLAALMWGGRVAIISTHNGTSNAFNQLVERCKSGELTYSLHETNLDDALAEGLYQQICKVQEVKWSQQKQDGWRSQLFRDYGRSADEELLAIPSTGGNGMIDPTWLQRYSVLPDRFDQIVISADTAAKAQQINDPWALLAFGVLGQKFYLIDCLIKRMDYPTGKAMLAAFVQKHRADTLLIEDKSTGQALIPELKSSRLISGTAVIPINPTADKVTRMSVETPAIESGALLLPITAHWLPEYESALLAFPNGLLDPVDATSQFLNWARLKMRRAAAAQVGGKLPSVQFGRRVR
jgi:predicted phage terminase large subunit-like protein